jgi:hypothetical protein
LIADQTAPRKQRHTAKRIWKRLVDERGVDSAVSMWRRRRFVITSASAGASSG